MARTRREHRRAARTEPSTRGWRWLGAALLAYAVVAIGCEGRPRDEATEDETLTSLTEDHVAELDLRSGVPEEVSAGLFGGTRPVSFTDLVSQLRDMPEEEKLKGVLIRLGASLGLARAEEIGRHVAVLRDKGLPVVCHAHSYDNSTMLVAARACDEIFVSPAGTVDTVGIAGQLIFGRALLDRLHVEVDFIQVGKFKGAKEPFTNEHASPEARRSLQNALSGLRAGWLDGVSEGRGKPAEELGIEDGPHTPEAAKALGLVDEIGFYRDARARALERAGVSGRVAYFDGKDQSADGFAGLLRALGGAGGSAVPHVAVVRATGGITMSRGGSLFGGSTGISHDALSKVLRRLEKNDATKAVVLRIDSPGGSALASDLLWRTLMDLRETKPLVVSVGGMAASGGYYLACAGNKIVAEKTSIIGSIGVVAGKLSFGKSLEEVGINVEAVPGQEGGKPDRALLASPLRGWDEATRAKLQAAIRGMYDLFISRIAEGRGVDAAAIEGSAEGRIMSGTAAKEGGLVDEIGGLSRAIEVAVELAGLDPSTPVDIVRDARGLLDMLGLEGARARRVALRELERRATERAKEVLTGGLLPYRSEITAFADSTAPLIQGERTIAALPYVLAVR
jgi:protease-4